MSMFLALAPASFAGLSKHRMTVRALAAFKSWLKETFNNPSFLGGRGHRNGPTNESGGVEVIVNDMLVWTILFLGPMPPLKTREVMMRKNPRNDLVGDDVHGHRVRVVSTIFNDNPRELAC